MRAIEGDLERTLITQSLLKIQRARPGPGMITSGFKLQCGIIESRAGLSGAMRAPLHRELRSTILTSQTFSLALSSWVNTESQPSASNFLDGKKR